MSVAQVGVVCHYYQVGVVEGEGEERKMKNH